jgi:type I restriction enzyme S subunit
MNFRDSGVWETVRLGDCFRIKHGFAFKGEFFALIGSKLVLTPGNFRPDGGLKFDGPQKFYTAEFPDEFILRKGDLIVVMTDLTQNAPILGSPAFIPEDGKYLHNQRLGKVVDIDNSRLDRHFLFYLFNYAKVRDQIKATATGATVRHTAPDRIYQVKVSLPPIAVQRRIATILSAYDNLIENNKNRIKILEEMAQTVYAGWFFNLQYLGHENTEKTRTPQEQTMKETKTKKLGNLADEIRIGISPKNMNPRTPYVGLANIPQKSIGLFEWGEIGGTTSTKLLFRKGDILFGKIRPYLHKVAVAPVDGGCSSDTIVIRPKTKDYYSLVLCCVSSDAFVAFADKTSKGTQMPRTDWKILQNYDVPYPPSALLSQFNSLVSQNIELMCNLILQNRVLAHTRDLLLPQLVSGELDVTELNIWGCD